MDVISYRGPGAAGGVSSGLANAWKKHSNDKWWFISDHSLVVLSQGEEQAEFITQLSDNLVSGHYRYCNELLWPLLHDLPQYASYNEEDHEHYRRFNTRVASFVTFEHEGEKPYFVQDYQFALVPRLLNIQGLRSTVFWHIPWPKHVPDEYVEQIAEIARALLSASVVGFHAAEYVENFMRFVSRHLAEYSVDLGHSVVRSRTAPFSPQIELSSPYVLRPYARRLGRTVSGGTRLVAKPLGIDVDQWQQMAECNADNLQSKLPADLLRHPMVLSVDRADYTKAVVDRMGIIDKFFETHPHLAGQMSFVQICGRSRVGLSAFDRYWADCATACSFVNDRWRRDGWQPVHWLQEPLKPHELSGLYRHAQAMLVNPVRDGLNLTAKEYAACQGTDAGVLILSPGAGAWHEIGNYCLPAHPHETAQAVQSLDQAFHMSPDERRTRNMLTRVRLEKFNLDAWWRFFHKAAHSRLDADRITGFDEDLRLHA